MLPEETVMNASITNFRILACPFERASRCEHSMEVRYDFKMLFGLIPGIMLFFSFLKVLIPTSVYFYGRQPIGGVIHGSINMESLIVNVNAPIIRSISEIMNQLTEGTTDVTLLPEALIPSDPIETLEETEDFWAVRPVRSTDIPITMGQIAYGMFSISNYPLQMAK